MEIVDEVKVQERNIEGLTGKVTRNVASDVEYPLIKVFLDNGVQKYKLEALSRLMKSGVKTDDSTLTNMSVSVGLVAGEKLKIIGRVMPTQIKTLMSTLTGLDVILELEEGKELDETYIYALSI